MQRFRSLLSFCDQSHFEVYFPILDQRHATISKSFVITRQGFGIYVTESVAERPFYCTVLLLCHYSGNSSDVRALLSRESVTSTVLVPVLVLCACTAMFTVKPVNI